MSRFIAIDRNTAYLLPSISEWLPENHLARFVVEVIDRLDLSEARWAEKVRCDREETAHLQSHLITHNFS